MERNYMLRLDKHEYDFIRARRRAVEAFISACSIPITKNEYLADRQNKQLDCMAKRLQDKWGVLV